MAAKDLILALGKPPTLGKRQEMPRAGADKNYRGVMSPMNDGNENEDVDGEEQENGPGEMLVHAAEDVMQALHLRDPEEFAAALKAFVSMSG